MNTDLKNSKTSLMLLSVKKDMAHNTHTADTLTLLNDAVKTKSENKIINILLEDMQTTNKMIEKDLYKFNNEFKIFELKNPGLLTGEVLEKMEDLKEEFMALQLSKIEANTALKQKMEGAIAFMKSTGLDDNIIKLFKKSMASEGMKPWETYTQTNKAERLSKVIMHRLEDPEFSKNLNSHPYQLPIAGNQIIDLEYKKPILRPRGMPYLLNTGEEKNKHPDQKADYFSYYLNYNYLERTKENQHKFKLIDQYILDLSTGDKEKAKFLKTILGSALIKGNPSQNFFLFTGKGSNGKSMLMNIINELLKELKIDISADLIVKKPKTSTGADPFLMEINDSKNRLLILNETEEGIHFDDALIKRLTGGDQIKARALYSNNTVGFTVESKLIVVSNHRPIFNVQDYGMKRRPKAIDFNSTFIDEPADGKYKPGQYKKDPELQKKILEDKDVLFSWFVEGAMLYKENPMFIPPEIVQKETDAYFYELDSIAQYLSSERLIFTDNEKDMIQQSYIYKDYIDYCKINNIKISKKSELYTKMDAKLQKKKKYGYINYLGIKWPDDDEDDMAV